MLRGNMSPEDLAPLLPAMTAWRRDIHAHPELGFQEHRTAALVAAELRAAGLEVTEGVGRTGVVGTLRRGAGNRAIGLRADMDALAMQDRSGAPWASTIPGRSHACGHDGHTAMLLGAARHLAEAGGFRGTVHFVFQPAEESLGGAQAMIDDGLFDRFPMDAVFGLHNMPGLPLGSIAVQDGPALASSDTWECDFIGIGTHGAKPHLGADAVLAAAQFIAALQSISARLRDPLRPGVVSVGSVHAGDPRAPNVIPGSVALTGTARAFDEGTREMQEAAIAQIAEGIAATLGVRAAPRYIRRNGPTVNDAAQAALAAQAAAAIGPVIRDFPPSTAGEDFSAMLRLRPGAYVWLGTGPAEEEARHHNPRFDFNDAALAHGAAYWCSLVRTALAPASGAA
jgi:hippurate hydrolase